MLSITRFKKRDYPWQGIFDPGIGASGFMICFKICFLCQASGFLENLRIDMPENFHQGCGASKIVNLLRRKIHGLGNGAGVFCDSEDGILYMQPVLHLILQDKVQSTIDLSHLTKKCAHRISCYDQDPAPDCDLIPVVAISPVPV